MSSPSLYPQGKGSIKSRYVGAALVFYSPTTGAELFRIDPTITGGYVIPGDVHNLRTRFTLSQINAGAAFLPAVPGFKYRLVEAQAIAYGGALAAGTTLDLLGTQAGSSVKLVAFGQAALTQSAVVKSGGTGGVVLADGASHAQNDVNTAITIAKTGSSFTTATGADLIVSYVLEP